MDMMPFANKVTFTTSQMTATYMLYFQSALQGHNSYSWVSKVILSPLEQRSTIAQIKISDLSNNSSYHNLEFFNGFTGSELNHGKYCKCFHWQKTA